MRGYKAFNKDLTCRGMQYEIGKEYAVKGEPKLCEQGFHFCEGIADCYKFYTTDDSTRICEVEATGDIVKGDFKYVTNKIKIIAEITNKNIRRGNTGDKNSGYINSGDYNSGTWNSGYKNSGNSNSGDNNSGNKNSGCKNDGIGNSGDWNSGDWNSGDSNSGHKNSGNSNSGNYNSGYRNSGFRNSGNRNSGSCNSGDWNSGNRSSGVFSTEKEPTIKMFDKETSWTYKDWYNSRARNIMEGCPQSYSKFIYAQNMTKEEKENHPEYKTIGGFTKTIKATKEERQEWWDSLNEDDKNEIKALPNFDEKKFCECVGIEHI